MNPLDNPLVFAVVCFGMIGPVLGLGILIPNAGAFLVTLFSAVFGEQVAMKLTGQKSGSDLINPNDLEQFKEEKELVHEESS